MEADSKKGIMTSHDIESVSHWVILRRCVHGHYGHSSSLSET